MNSDISISRLKQFPPLMWIMLFGSFITRGSFYMVWPFLAVILYKKFALSATEVGSVLSLAAVISVFVSFVGSTLSDKLGRKPMMYATGVLYIISFSLLAIADTIVMFTIVITLCSIATSLWRPLASALIGDIIPEKATRELAMQSLYFAVNVGCAVGPMLGVWLGLTGEQSSFFITVYAFAFLLVLLTWGFKHQDKKHAKVDIDNPDSTPSTETPETKTGFKQTFSVLVQDKLLQCLILANILCFFIYGQMDSSLVQYLTRAGANNLLELVSSMIFTNAIVIITCQFLLLKLLASRPILVRIRFGLVLLICSQIWFAFNPLTFFAGWLGAVVIMSLAEAILFPTMSVHVDRIAPTNLRGAYFGATAFYDLGYALAPIGGGLLLDMFDGRTLFLVCTAIAVVVFLLYLIMDKLKRPAFITEQLATEQTAKTA
ncbi:MDR family MFS transporter [Pseudoalteromonas piratica]|uniref:MFS transporter n=1 Tax=Pseudoalteromonas piratica TaxID=1348114 RepID=A0A0A7ELA2_9GAMM|nr:MFS transporter [Pseudoalteromonas piratica]AIY66851.1 MFS transporter [Pseudoalteromonas piratica]